MTAAHEPSDAELAALWRARPRRRFVRVSAVVLVLLMTVAWIFGDFGGAGARAGRASDFLQRLVPAPLADGSIAGAYAWAGDLWRDGGSEATLATLEIAAVAAALAMLAGLLLATCSARSVVTPEPFLPGGRPPPLSARSGWLAVASASRLVQMLLRSVPDYLWAFLLLTALGAGAWPWPAVLALALHNAGILGRLSAETVENTPPATMAALRGVGATRRALVACVVWPACFPRLLLYFFYRFETCVRDATVLGMLGTGSLGFRIDAAANRFAYDEMLFFVLVAAGIVIAADLLSSVVRRGVRVN